MTKYNSATPVSGAMSLVFAVELIAVAFAAWMKENTKPGKKWLVMDGGKGRVLVASGIDWSLNAERDVRNGTGFNYTGADGKPHHTTLRDIGIEFTRCASLDGVYAYDTLTAESSGLPIYDGIMGRKGKETKGKEKDKTTVTTATK